MLFVTRPANLVRVAFAAMLVLGLSVLAAPAALAQDTPRTLGDMTNSVYDSLASVQYFLSLLSYILGLFFTITGLQMLKGYIDDPGQNPAQASMLRLGAAALFLFSPTAANMLVGTIGDGEVFNGDTTHVVTTQDAVSISSSTFSSGGGLENALGRFVIDFGGPFLDNLLPLFAYLSGVVLMLVGLKRLALANGQGPQAPGSLGTFSTFIIAAGLMSFGYVMYTLQGTFFGKTTLYGVQKLTGGGSAITDHAEHALWAVFIFLRIVGYISVLRGLFMLREVTEGGQASMVGVSTHMFAGAALANLGYVVNMIQCTFLESSSFVFNTIDGGCS